MLMADHKKFSHLHEHELIFEDEKNLDTDDVKAKFCNICGFLMFINTCYTCREEGCNFSVHKQCADLPEKKDFIFDSRTHSLSLTPNDNGPISCAKCFQICNNFRYVSTKRFWNLYFHPFCVLPTEIKTKHRSHHDHPMTPTYKTISASCDACGEDDKKDHFLSCQACNFWIHKECASLPSIGIHATHDNHPLILLFSNPFSRQKTSWSDDGKCKICEKDLPIQNGVYTCQACGYFVHIKCVKSQIKPLTPQESSQQITVLPPAEEECEVFPSFIIRNQQREFNGTTAKRMTPEECHHHPLTSHDGSCNDNNKTDIDKKMLTISGVCNSCVQPVSSSCKYYSCSEAECHFLVHELCATLSSTRIESKFPGSQIDLFTKSTDGYFHYFFCDFCYRPCNGFRYQINDPIFRRQSITADVECASATRIIKHQSHNHILHLIKSSYLDYSQRRNFSCCTSYCTEFLYMCISCDFKIHVSCALLPKKVTHEFDDHPLQLITEGNGQGYFCEFCEEDIDLNFWFYRCAEIECDQSFHVNCIPSVGKFSKFKFGGTISGVLLPSHSHRDLPLTCVRMLTIGSQTCGDCKSTIPGFTDYVAFQCSTCDFWIHWECARNKGYNLQ